MATVNVLRLAQGLGVSVDFVTQTLEADSCDVDPALSAGRLRTFQTFSIPQAWKVESVIITGLNAEARVGGEKFDKERYRIAIRCLAHRYTEQEEAVTIS